MMGAAEQLYARTFQWIMTRTTLVANFRQVAAAGLAAASNVVLWEAAQWVEQADAAGTFDGLFTKAGQTPRQTKEQVFAMMGGHEAMAKGMAATTMASHKYVVDAASLAFAHSTLDATADNLCTVIALLDARYFAPVVESRKVTLREVREEGYMKLLTERVARYLEELARDKLIKKVNALEAVCRPDDTFRAQWRGRYDRRRIQFLDQRRHKVVHGEGTPRPLPRGDTDLKCLDEACMYLFILVNQGIGVRVDPNDFGKAMTDFPLPGVPAARLGRAGRKAR